MTPCLEERVVIATHVMAPTSSAIPAQSRTPYRHVPWSCGHNKGRTVTRHHKQGLAHLELIHLTHWAMASRSDKGVSGPFPQALTRTRDLGVGVDRKRQVVVYLRFSAAGEVASFIVGLRLHQVKTPDPTTPLNRPSRMPGARRCPSQDTTFQKRLRTRMRTSSAPLVPAQGWMQWLILTTVMGEEGLVSFK
jgi:hypothetical protein